MTNYTPSALNVLRTYAAADADALDYGMRWYVEAHDTALRINPRSRGGKRIRTAAGVIAALSPMMGWDSNVKQASIAIARKDATGLGLSKNCAKAQAILDGADPLDVLRGDKVRAFYQTILNPLGYDVPVIDRHAFDVAVGEVTNDAARTILGRKGVYDAFGKAYIVAAGDAGISASQMQAITWVAWRKAKGIK